MRLKAPFTRVKLPKEDPVKKAERLKKRQQNNKVLESLGVTVGLRSDVAHRPDFLTAEERETYAKDCMFATLFLKSEQELPEDLKQRLLAVKARREAFLAK